MVMFGSFAICAVESVLNCLQTFRLRRVDTAEKEITEVDRGMKNSYYYETPKSNVVLCPPQMCELGLFIYTCTAARL